MIRRRHLFIQQGQYAAEVEVDVIETEEGCLHIYPWQMPKN